MVYGHARITCSILDASPQTIREKQRIAAATLGCVLPAWVRVLPGHPISHSKQGCGHSSCSLDNSESSKLKSKCSNQQSNDKVTAIECYAVQLGSSGRAKVLAPVYFFLCFPQHSASSLIRTVVQCERQLCHLRTEVLASAQALNGVNERHQASQLSDRLPVPTVSHRQLLWIGLLVFLRSIVSAERRLLCR